MRSAKASPRVLPFTPAVSQPTANGEGLTPYPVRIVRAVMVLLGAVCIHIWGVEAPHPQQMPIAAFAARMMRLPGIPLAPPLHLRASSRFSPGSKHRVTVENKVVRVPPLPPRAIPPRTLRAEQLAVPVGTSGRLAQAFAPEPSSPADHLPAAPLLKSSDAAVVPPSAPEPAGPTSPVADPVAGSGSLSPRPGSTTRPAESRRASAPSNPPDSGTAETRPAQKDTEVVLAVLREYSRAYEHMDVRATKAVYPSVDDRRLRRAFDDLQEQHVRFASCGVTISSSGAGANAWCKGDASFRPKVGSPKHYPNREWNFSLAREGGGWQILKATIQ